MNRQPSVGQHNFAKLPQVQARRSSFNRSHGHKTTIKNFGDLVPILVDEVIPGDTFNCNANIFGRLATPITPVMHPMFAETFFFFVPNRLLWENFERFMGHQDDPTDSVDFLIPQVACPVGGFLNDTLYDHMGLPTEEDIENTNNLHARAYNLIWNSWFRDQNLQDSVVVDIDDGPDVDTDYVIKKRGKRHDYFTSCLPWPQKGDAVSLPLGTSAPITGLGIKSSAAFSTIQATRETDGSGTVNYTGAANSSNTAQAYMMEEDPNNATFPNIRADLSNAAAATVNELREAFAVQRLYEKDARGGTRYTEIIQSHFGVTSPDARLQRPEYLGGGRSSMNIQPIAQTSSTDGTTPQGNLAGYGTVQGGGHSFNKSFTEHGVIIGLISMRADINYQQGLDRMFSRQTKLDFYWPTLAHLGEQAVLSKEIFCDGAAGDQDVWGYQERFSEYRHKQSQITGQMRSNFATSLDQWHLAQDFSTRPVLDDTFIEENPPIDRVVALTSEPDVILDVFFNYTCARPMPTYAIPKLQNHF